LDPAWETLRKSFSREDVYALKDAARASRLLHPESGPLHEIILLLGLHESFRLDELVQLRVENLDLSRKQPKIWVQAPGRTSKRMVTISRTLRDLLAELIHWKKESRLPSGPSEIDYLFTDRSGRRMDARDLETILARLAEEAGV